MKRNTKKQSVVLPEQSVVAAAVSGALVATAVGSTAWAQQIEEVIVTATKREESVEDVPLAITALSGTFVESVNLNDV